MFRHANSSRALVAALVVALSLSACAGEAQTTSTVDPTTTSSTVETTTSIAPAPTTTSTSAPEPGLEGADTSRLDAAAVGEIVQVGDWRLRITAVTPDATDTLLEDDFNEPPGDGEQFFMAQLEATYSGSETGNFFFDLSISAVGDSAVTYDSFEDSCGFVPDDINQALEAWPGGTIHGNVCWKIGAGDIESMVLIVDEFFGTAGDRAFLSMDPNAAVAENTTSIGETSIDTSEAVPLGEPATVAGWEIRVVDVVSDANSLILDEASFNESPRDGHQFFIVGVEATYVGDESGNLFTDTSFESVGNESVVYNEYSSTCGFVPGSISFTSEAFPGGTVTGNACWEIRSADAESLALLVSAFSASDVPRVMFSLAG